MRVGSLVSLLLVEILVLSLRFDVQPLRSQLGAWGWLAASFGAGGKFLLVTVAATCVVWLGRRRGTRIDSVAAPPPTWRPRVLAIHAILYAVFFALSSRLCTPGASPNSLFLTAWLVAGPLWLGSGILIACPLRELLVWCRRHRTDLVLGLLAGTSAWWLGTALRQTWSHLAWATLHSSAAILHRFVDHCEVNSEHLELATDQFHINIAPSCSGYEGIGLLWVFLATYLWLYRKELRFPRVLWLFPVGTVVMWCTNVLRITALVLLGHAGHQEVAIGGFHSSIGWVLFCAVSLSIVAGTRYWSRLRMPSTPAGEASPLTAAYLVPLLATLAVKLITESFAVELDWAYGLRALAGGASLVCFWRCYSDWGTSKTWAAVTTGILVFFVWSWLSPAPPGDIQAFLNRTGWTHEVRGWLWLVGRGLGLVIVIPLVEELAFRGFLLRRLIREDFSRVPTGSFTWFSFLGSSLLFGALHSSLLAGSLAGAAYAGVTYYSRGLSAAVVAHMTTNGLLLAGYLLQ